MDADQRRDLDIDLAKKEARKRFRSAVRLECAIAADYVIGRHMPDLNDLIEKSLSEGELPALEAEVAAAAKKIASLLTEALEGAMDQLALESGSDS